ncbi:MAG: hypothetical protein RLZZ387_2933 [Chloroflexota bacterium]|jgi:hypothetical protein
MAEEHDTGMVAALYACLADAEAALNALLADGVAYEQTHMGAHEGPDPLRASVSANLPERFWSLAVRPADREPEWFEERLAAHHPLSVGRLRSPELERSDSERGAVAWGHFVFESPESTQHNPESTGTSGTTGVVNTGAFAEGANAQREPDTAKSTSTGLAP